MQILSTILLCLAAILVLIFILAAFAPTHWSIAAETTINKPKQAIFDYLKMLRNGEQFNKWVMTDPNMKKEFRGTDGTVGFVYSWESKMQGVGIGEQEIIHLKDGEQIDYEIRFKKPFEGVSSASFELSQVSENETKVVWTFSSSNTYMMKVMHVALNLKKVLLKDLKTSLNNLKTILEK